MLPIRLILSVFIRQHSGVDLQLDVTNKARVVEDLEKNRVDLALVSIIPEHLGLQTVAVMHNHLVMVVSPERAFENLSLIELFEKVPLIYREPGSGTRQVQEQFVKDKGLMVQKKMELTSNEAVKQAVLAGLGCSVMPIIGLKNELQLGQVKIVPISGLPLTTTWQLVWLKSKTLSPAATAFFVEYVRLQRETLSDKYFGWHKQFL